MDVKIVPAYNHTQEVGKLFLEYTDMLLKEDPSFKKYLEVQNYEEELQQLNIKYGQPDGRLYIVYSGEKLAGCIGLKKMDELSCEMKRLYVRPEFRGLHIGKYLIQHIIDDAREIGYKHMFLDTFPFLRSAIQIYERFGFNEVEKYNDSPMDSAIYMKLDL